MKFDTGEFYCNVSSFRC